MRLLLPVFKKYRPPPRLSGRPDFAAFVIDLPSDLGLIEAAVAYLVGRCRAFDFAGPRLDLNFRVGVTEALANAVLYGNGCDPAKTVRIDVSVDTKCVEVRVTDQGDGFDPSDVPDPTAPENLESPGGRGLFLIRNLMDEMEFNDRGNEVRMVLARREQSESGDRRSSLSSTPTPVPTPASVSNSIAPRSDPGLDPLRELLQAYARAHDAEVWLWQRVGEEWEMVVGTASPPAARPGSHAVAVPMPAGPESCIEITARDNTTTTEAAEFLAFVVGNTLKHQAEMRFFGGEIAERYEEITLLYTISEILGSVISLEEAAREILGEVVDTMSVKRAALWVHEPELHSLRLVAAVGGEGFAGPISLVDDTSITASVFRERRAMILEQSDEFPRDTVDFEPTNRESFLSVPVSYTPPQGQARTIGVINLIGRRVEEGFSAGDHKLIAAIASQVGAAVENSRLVSDSLHRERVDREMELAHDLQLKLLPSADQFRDRAEVAAKCAPADSVGGDFYHLFRLPGGRFGVVIGDVSSHGFGAALIMALTMSAVAIHASEGDQPAEVLRRAHRALADELASTEMYLTIFYGVIDPTDGRLSYANAGHQHAFVVSRAGDARRLSVTNPPFGLVDLADYAEESIDWQPREDLLFLFTDGLSDAIGVSTGETRLVDQVSRDRDQPLDQILQGLFDIEAFEAGIPADDRTAVLVRV